MKLLIPLSVLLAVCHGTRKSIFGNISADIVKSEYTVFKIQYKKNYTSSEEEVRLKVFRENRKIIDKHNAAYARGQVSFELGMNQFGDMLSYEVTEMLNGLKYDKSAPRNGSKHLRTENVIPKEIDWRDHGYVTKVKDQGHCGSCWAFSSTGSLEGQHFRATGKLVSLSEQNLIDCSGKEGNEGCNGGVMEYAFDYVELNKGIDTEVSYPYKSGHGKTFPCKFNPKTVGATDTGFTDIPTGDENVLLEAVATIGPISVGIDANHASFHLYKSGVYYEPECDSMNVDHAVLVVGYGTTEDGQDYWLVKNSWDTTWGDNGYIKMARNRDNNCGIATYAVYPRVL